MPLISLPKALAIYRRERERIKGGPHPQPACSCGFCDVIRAADLVYTLAKTDAASRRWRAPIRKVTR